MERKKSDSEFEVTLDAKGRIVVPKEVAQRFAGKRINVFLSSKELAEDVKARMVTEEEIEKIARAQLESRDQVMMFLATEGALRTNRRFVRFARGAR